jgi:hypothetical protein
MSATFSNANLSGVLITSVLVSPGLFAAGAHAQSVSQPEAIDQVIRYTQDLPQPAQVTSVSQLSDVKPTDWAFQALQSLVERYGCIAGYPDKTYRGNRPLSRYEFAAGLNACMDRVNELIGASTADLAKKEDLEALRKLQEEFKAELETIRGQVDGLEARATTLEKQQFSTTSKLVGEVVVGLSGVLGDDRALNSDQQRTIDRATTAAARNAATVAAYGAAGRNVQENTILTDRVRLAIDTSFSGKDRLRTQLQARNFNSFSGNVTGTNMSRLGYDGNSDNAFQLRRIEYRMPLGNQGNLFIGGGAAGEGLEFNDSIATLSPVESSGSGAISRFGRFNPIYRAATGTGIIANYKLGKEFTTGNKFTLSLGYLVPSDTASNPAPKNGLFDGTHAALAQLAFQPNPNVNVAFTYANSYYTGGSGVSGSTGSSFANNPFNGVATHADSYGLQASVKFGPKFILSGWGGFTSAEAKQGLGTGATATVRRGDDAEIWNWAVTAALLDVGKEGSLLGFVFGMPPKVTESDFGLRVPTLTSARREDEDTSYHLELFYRYKVSDNISITPGLLVILNPEHNSANDTIYVGTIRTTFTF